MEPLETDYVVPSASGERQRPQSSSRSRLGVLFIFPIIGFVVVLAFAGAAIFQWNLAGIVSPLIGVLLLLFLLLIVLLFWGLAPRTEQS